MIILNRNGRQHLNACLDSVLGQRLDRTYEVILVDNASRDGSVGYVSAAYPTVRILTAPHNLGFAAGNNLGLKQARAPFLILLNNDTVVRDGWLLALITAAETDDRVGAVQSKLVFADRPGIIQSAGTLLLSDGSGGDRGSGEPDGNYGNREEVFAACGAASLYRRAALDDVGMLDESFFMYYEDTDLSWRLRLRGWKVLFEPAAVVEHVHAASSGPGSPLMRFHADRNRLLMLVKNAPIGFIIKSFRQLAGRAAHGADAPRAGGGTSRGRVLGSFLLLLPRAIAARVWIRARRTVPDGNILAWAYPREKWDSRTGS